MPISSPPPKKTKPAQSAKWNVLRNVLDYVRAMRTAHTISADEAAEWVTLEQEFTKRADESKDEAA